MNGYTNIPIDYQGINIYNSSFSPSTLHSKNTNLVNFFAKYLLMKAMSVFKWTLPEEWASNYFLYSLYLFGYVGVLRTDKFGVICQACGITGYDVYYQPTTLLIANPLIDKTLQPRIGKDCTLIKLQPDYSGISDIVNYYADMLAIAAETAGFNMFNSKLSYVFNADGKAGAETLKKLFDSIASGEPAAFVNSKVSHTVDGKPAWNLFTQNVGTNYIAGALFDDMRKIENEFNTLVGIPNANTQKKERMIQDEVNQNNRETMARTILSYDELQKTIGQTNDMFGLNIKCEHRYRLEEM